MGCDRRHDSAVADLRRDHTEDDRSSLPRAVLPSGGTDDLEPVDRPRSDRVVLLGHHAGLLRLLRIDVDGDEGAVTEDDIRALAALGHIGGQIEDAEREIIDALFNLDDRAVREVMTPRLDIVTIGVPVTADEIRTAVSETGHSRFPVTGSDLDHLVGIVHVKDLLQQDGNDC